MSTTPSVTTQKNLLWAGIAFAAVGIIIYAIPIVGWELGDAGTERLVDIAGTIVFIIGIIMIVAFAAFYIKRHWG